MKKIVLIMIICSILTVGCLKPPKIEINETIETNETAFLVPLEGKSKEGQGKFMSVDYLEKAKVATKRITIPQRERKIGRFDHTIEWIPTMRLIKVNRLPVTREWTEEKTSGTSNKDEAIYVESKDSIGFSVGVNITTMITEENAAKFLYFYAGKSLPRVTDGNVRGKVTAVLSREFGMRDLAQCKSEKRKIQETLEKEVKGEFTKYGISVSSIGLVGGLTYEDKTIQDAINDAYIAEMSILQSKQEMEAEKHRNTKKVSIAVAERQAAQEFEKAYEAMVKKIELEVEMKKADALLEAAKKWNGSTPSSILPQGSNLLFGLDR